MFFVPRSQVFDLSFLKLYIENIYIYVPDVEKSDLHTTSNRLLHNLDHQIKVFIAPSSKCHPRIAWLQTNPTLPRVDATGISFVFSADPTERSRQFLFCVFSYQHRESIKNGNLWCSLLRDRLAGDEQWLLFPNHPYRWQSSPPCSQLCQSNGSEKTTMAMRNSLVYLLLVVRLRKAIDGHKEAPEELRIGVLFVHNDLPANSETRECKIQRIEEYRLFPLIT